jgi:hypothetical protein
MKTMRQQIVDRIERLGAGKAFMAKDFLDIASRGTIDMTLSSLIREGSIRRVRRGLYDSPHVNPSLGGALSPDIDETARALARRYRWRIIPDGTLAASLLGLSTRVPAKIVYLSDGPNKKIELGRRAIHFKHARPQRLSTKAAISRWRTANDCATWRLRSSPLEMIRMSGWQAGIQRP